MVHVVVSVEVRVMVEALFVGIRSAGSDHSQKMKGKQVQRNVPSGRDTG